MLGIVNKENISISEFSVGPDRIGKLVALINSGEITGKIAKTIFEDMLTSTDSPEKIVESKGLKVVRDDKALEEIIVRVIASQPESVEAWNNGKDRALGAIVGAVMKETKGKAILSLPMN